MGKIKQLSFDLSNVLNEFADGEISEAKAIDKLFNLLVLTVNTPLGAIQADSDLDPTFPGIKISFTNNDNQTTSVSYVEYNPVKNKIQVIGYDLENDEPRYVLDL